MFITRNSFQILLTSEVTKRSIFYADVVIVYINPGGGHRDHIVVEFTTTSDISYYESIIVSIYSVREL
jgi:hypothetical protein